MSIFFSVSGLSIEIHFMTNKIILSCSTPMQIQACLVPFIFLSCLHATFVMLYRNRISRTYLPTITTCPYFILKKQCHHAYYVASYYHHHVQWEVIYWYINIMTMLSFRIHFHYLFFSQCAFLTYHLPYLSDSMFS